MVAACATCYGISAKTGRDDIITVPTINGIIGDTCMNYVITGATGDDISIVSASDGVRTKTPRDGVGSCATIKYIISIATLKIIILVAAIKFISP